MFQCNQPRIFRSCGDPLLHVPGIGTLGSCSLYVLSEVCNRVFLPSCTISSPYFLRISAAITYYSDNHAGFLVCIRDVWQPAFYFLFFLFFKRQLSLVLFVQVVKFLCRCSSREITTAVHSMKCFRWHSLYIYVNCFLPLE